MAQSSSKNKRWYMNRNVLRYGLIAGGVFVFLTAAIYGTEKFEQFLIRDPRFLLPGPADYGMENSNLELIGVKYASRWMILHQFEPDYGRSLYLLPLADRRKAVLNIRWVRDASIIRIWPNRVQVRIQERQPSAFIKLPGDNIARWALIDDEGIILDPPAKANFRLPVMTGVRQSESTQLRGTRVRRMQRLMKDLGPLANNVSEVDAGDLDNLRVIETVEGNAVSLMLGDRNFSSRLQNFLDHYSDIHRRMPQAASFDLRLDDRITALEVSDAR